MDFAKMNYPKEEYISLFGKDAFFIQKSIRDTGKLSYFGGYPSLPKESIWPTTIYNGKESQLPFLAQINLKDLPEIHQYLPKKGILYFFYDISFEENQHPSQVCVVYSKEEESLETKPKQGMLPCFNDDCMMTGLFLYRHPDLLKGHPRDCFPKNEVSFFKYRDINNPIHEYTENTENFSFWNDRNIERNRRISSSIDSNFGIQESDINLDIYSQIGRNKLPQWLVNQLEYKSEKIKIKPLGIRWPQSWFHIEVFCYALKKELSKKKDIVEINEDYEHLHSFISNNEKWLNHARNSIHSKKVPDTEALEFRNWVYENYLNALNSASKSKISFTIRASIEHAIPSFIFATNWLVDLNNNGMKVFTEDEVEIIDRYRKNSSHHPHQMFGHGEPNERVDYKEDTYQDSILLLQLSWDDTLMWNFGDLSTLQFRISRDALQELRFEETSMELIM